MPRLTVPRENLYSLANYWPLYPFPSPASLHTTTTNTTTLSTKEKRTEFTDHPPTMATRTNFIYFHVPL